MSAVEPIETDEGSELDDLLLQRLEGLRRNLLDLSNRNRLLSFKHSERARTHIRIIDELPDILYERLRDGHRLPFKALPEPETEPPEERSDLFLIALEAARTTDLDYTVAMAGLRDDELNSRKAAEIERTLRDKVRETLDLPPWTDERMLPREDFARQHDLEPSYELPWQTQGSEQAQRHLDAEIQTLLFPAEMERKLSGIVDQARTMLQEAGVNTLYAAFGFLEYFEEGAGEQKQLAPLLLLPVQIDRKMSTPWRRYSLTADGADFEVNETLAIRLSSEFGYELPDIGEEQTPESYLRRVSKDIAAQPRWRVRRFVTVGHYGFSKLPMYNDLWTELWNGGRELERHELVRQLLLGGTETDDSIFVAKDYQIDSPEIDAKDLKLVADADASQHSALVDVADGKSLVIQGPPGTGKSQTITNIIAALIAQGKSVLFVAEKLAALNVVHARLKHSKLDDFCLLVHSNKTPKLSALDALKSRIDIQNTLEEPQDFATKIEELKQSRDRLNHFAETLNNPIGELGLTVQQVLWADQRSKMAAGEGCESAGDLMLTDAADLTALERTQFCDAIREMFTRLESIVVAHSALADHPWSWVERCETGPFAEEEFRTRTADWLDALTALGEARDALTTDYGCRPVQSFGELRTIAEALGELPDVPPQPIPAIVKVISEDGLGDAVRALLDSLAGPPTDRKGQYGEPLFMPNDRLPTDRNWKHVAEITAQALDVLSEEMRDAIVLADAEQYAGELRMIASLVERAIAIAHSVQSAVGIPKSSSLHDLTQALEVLGIVAALPQESLAVRDANLLYADAELTIKEAMETVRQLRRDRHDLQQLFILRPLPDIEDVVIHARALRGAGSLAFFDTDVRDAKKFFKSISNGENKQSTAEMVASLARLEAYLDQRRAFDNDEVLKGLCGHWFKGEDTEFSRFLDLIAWQADVSVVLAQPDEATTLYRRTMLHGSFEILSEFRSAAHSLNIDAAIEEITSLCEEVDDLEEEISSAFLKVGRIERACRDLTGIGVAATARFDTLAVTVLRLKAIDDVRVAARNAHEESQTTGLEIAHLHDALAYLVQIGEMAVPAQLKVRLAERCRQAEFDRMRDHGQDIAQHYEAAVRRRSELYVPDASSGAEAPAPQNDNEVLDYRTNRVQTALQNPGLLGEWIDYLGARERAGQGGLAKLMAGLEELCVSADRAVATFDWVVYQSIARSAYEMVPDLAEMSGASIAQLRQKFQTLDRDILALQRRKLAADLCRRPIAQGNGVGHKSSFTELSLIRHEISKKRRHVPLRDLFARSAQALQQLKPCFMMSPLSVATFLQPGEVEFDVVIIDEASQMPLEDALGAIARARQCVIVGDNMQLPPTSFFKRFDDAIDEDDEFEDEELDVESVLDQAMNVFRPPRALKWHYRSQHQNLIAFSNKQFYENQLTVFPSFREDDERYGVKLVQVDGQYADRRNLAEVEDVAEWARRFMITYPERSLGIVAVNQLQRDLIRDEMDRIFQRDREAEDYRRTWEKTLYPFFVKNLENVQGDERDAIAISTVYGPDANGKVLQNFGPISKKNGHRRLNVLFTRARQQVAVFTSLTPEHIQIKDTTGPGPRALRAYLEYAQSSRLEPGWAIERLPENDFELAVSSLLAEHGYDAVPKVGVAGYFIDLGIRHPDFPGQFLVGVECDGATYHSAKSARDRDRLRDDVLKAQGWVVYRIWSTDWFRDPDGEVRKLIGFIEQQVEQRRSQLTAADNQPAIAPPATIETVPEEQHSTVAHDLTGEAVEEQSSEVVPEPFDAPSNELAPAANDDELDGDVALVEFTNGDKVSRSDELDAEPEAIDDLDAAREPEVDRDPAPEPEAQTDAGPEPEAETDPAPEAPETVSESVAEPDEPVCAVGDMVVFHYEDAPEEALAVLIVIGESDIEKGTVSRLSPIGDALIDAGVGQTVEVYLAEGIRNLVVDRIRKEQAALIG